MNRITVSEEQRQKTVADWLDLHAQLGFIWFHVPNGGHISQMVKTKRGWKRVSFLGKRRKRMGAKAGVPDIIVIFEGGRVLQIEMKSKRGRVTPAQKEWRDRSRKLDIPYHVARSVDDVARLVKAEIKKGAS